MGTKRLHWTSKIKLIIYKIKTILMNIEIKDLTGVFLAFILMWYMQPWKALTIGFFGYLIYTRIERTLFIASKNK